jgi:hypothetical protein
MQEFAAMQGPQRTSHGPVAPVCLACGNRSLFVRDTAHGVSGVTIDRVMALPDLTGVRCGRCRCHHCVVVEYDE